LGCTERVDRSPVRVVACLSAALLIRSVAIIIALGLVTVEILEFQFSGSIAVSSDPRLEVNRFSALTRGP
jgi:hypothetical protein